MFIDRKDAGKKLALKLEKYKDNDVIAQDTIRKYGYKWDLAISRKIGAPLLEESIDPQGNENSIDSHM